MRKSKPEKLDNGSWSVEAYSFTKNEWVPSACCVLNWSAAEPLGAVGGTLHFVLLPLDEAMYRCRIIRDYMSLDDMNPCYRIVNVDTGDFIMGDLL